MSHFEQVKFSCSEREKSQNTRDHYEENISEVDRVTTVYSNRIKFRNRIDFLICV